MTIGVPPAIERVAAAWRRAGADRQAAFDWPRDNWLAAFLRRRDMLTALPPRLDRDDVRRACARAAASERAAETALLAVFAWGYGDNGYGPFRADEALSTTPDARRRLMHAVRTLEGDGPVAAYRRLSRDDDCRVTHLGPAFATKFLYFCQPRPAPQTALILDSLVSKWLRREVGLRATSARWSVTAYDRYLDHMHRWSSSLGCEPDDLEYAIFRVMAAETGSRWGT